MQPDELSVLIQKLRELELREPFLAPICWRLIDLATTGYAARKTVGQFLSYIAASLSCDTGYWAQQAAAWSSGEPSTQTRDQSR